MLSERNRRYRAFGLTISSEVTLAELAPIERDLDGHAFDVEIVRAREPLPIPTFDKGVDFQFGPENQYLGWAGVGAFLIRGDARIEITPADDAPESYIALPLLGPVIALLLHLRGFLVLHASAVAINGKSAIFVGDKMAGKSTTAASFLRRGYALVTDDLLAVEIGPDREVQIHPAFAQVKLSEQASAAIQIAGARALPLVHDSFPKRQHRLEGNFSSENLPAGAIFILERGGDVPSVEAVSGIEAMKAVMRFSYVTRFGKKALPATAEAKHLVQCVELARSCPIYRLTIPDSVDRLDETVTVVESCVA